MNPPRQVKSDVLSALPAAPHGYGLRPHEVHASVGRWARSTVRHALRELVEEGAAEFDGPDGGRVYRKSQSVNRE